MTKRRRESCTAQLDQTGHAQRSSGAPAPGANQPRRADYAAGDAAVLPDPAVANQTFELAGDHGFTLGEYAAALANISDKPVSYIDMPEAKYKETLERAGLPERISAMLAEASAKSARDIMFDDGRALSKLISRPTTFLHATLARDIRSLSKRTER